MESLSNPAGTGPDPQGRKPVDRDWSEQELADYKMHRRFDRFGRLVGDRKMKRLMGAHVMVVGLGGVGSWAAEMVARSGVGKITIVDFDEVCITNFNRQLHAVGAAVGEKKAIVVADRLKRINPQAEIVAKVNFYNADYADEVFSERPDFVIDAIDSITPKCMLLAHCHRENIPVVTSTGSAGRLDPTRIRVADLAETEIDPLARAVRRILRQQYGFPEKGAFGLPAVYSPEPASEPVDLKYDNGKGFKCVCPQGDNAFFQCDNRNLIMGSAGFVTAAFGMACASHAIRTLMESADAAAPSASGSSSPTVASPGPGAQE